MLRCALLAFAMLLPGAASGASVEVIGPEGERLASVDADRWCIHWNHSVAGFEVRDCYAFRNGRMLLTDSHQPDFAAGLGHIQGRGIVSSDNAGGYLISGIDEAVPGNCYRLRVGSPKVDHRIVAADATISLSAIAAGRSVMVRAAEMQGTSDTGQPEAKDMPTC